LSLGADRRAAAAVIASEAKQSSPTKDWICFVASADEKKRPGAPGRFHIRKNNLSKDDRA
jgi:hypothetical protein